MIEATGLKKTYQRGHGRKASTVEAVRGVDFAVRQGEIFGFLGPNGAGKTTTLRMLSTLHRARTAARPASPAPTCCAAPAEVRRQHRLRRAGRRHLRRSPPPARNWCCRPGCTACRKAEAQRRAEAAVQGLRADRLRRPQDQDLLRRPAPPPRHRAGRHPLAEGDVPRRADRRPGPAEPGPDVGGGPPAARRGHDGLPHHPLPGRGRRAVRPDRDHRRRRDRRRGHPAGAQARDLRRRGRARHGRLRHGRRGRRPTWWRRRTSCSARSPTSAAPR